MTDFERAQVYKEFLSRLYVYRNITMDPGAIRRWLEKLDAWGRGCSRGWESEEDWQLMLDVLKQSEATR